MPMATLSLCCPGAALSEVECSAACTRRAPCLLVIRAAAARVHAACAVFAGDTCRRGARYIPRYALFDCALFEDWLCVCDWRRPTEALGGRATPCPPAPSALSSSCCTVVELAAASGPRSSGCVPAGSSWGSVAWCTLPVLYNKPRLQGCWKPIRVQDCGQWSRDSGVGTCDASAGLGTSGKVPVSCLGKAELEPCCRFCCRDAA